MRTYKISLKIVFILYNGKNKPKGGNDIKIKIVSDSTCDIPRELAEEMNITIVPLYVLFGKDTYRDGIDITPDEFYEMQGKSNELPKTSQPSVGEFAAVTKNY